MYKKYFVGGTLFQILWDVLTHSRLFTTPFGLLFVIGDALMVGGTCWVAAKVIFEILDNQRKTDIRFGNRQARGFQFYFQLALPIGIAAILFLSLNGVIHHSVHGDPFDSSYMD